MLFSSSPRRGRSLAVLSLMSLSLFVAAPSEAASRTRQTKSRKVASRPAELQAPAPPVTAAPKFVGGPEAPADTDTAELFGLVNAARSANGLPALLWDPNLATMAVDWSVNMSAQGFRHRDGSTVSLPASVRYTGENIAWGLRTPVGGLHQSLMDSPGHRANLLSTKSNRIGLGIVKVGEETWITQNFGVSA
jgi:uncharacterized protein YkwD